MAYSVELSTSADRELDKLDAKPRKEILKFLNERVATAENPRSLGHALRGSQLGDFWRYRVGDYRLICELQDQRLIVLVVRLGHRKEIYR